MVHGMHPTGTGVILLLNAEFAEVRREFCPLYFLCIPLRALRHCVEARKEISSSVGDIMNMEHSNDHIAGAYPILQKNGND